MSEPRDVVRRLTLQWLAKADDDARAAHAMLAIRPMPAWIAAFHAQQCVEKSLKAFLVHRQVEFPFIHDLGMLLDLCGAPLRSSPELCEVVDLTAYAVAARYPGIEPTPERARDAVERAAKAHQHIVLVLSAGGVRA